MSKGYESFIKYIDMWNQVNSPWNGSIWSQLQFIPKSIKSKKKRKKESILIDQRQLLWNIDFKIAASKNVYLHLNKITLDCYIIKVKSFTETVWKWVCESH